LNLVFDRISVHLPTAESSLLVSTLKFFKGVGRIYFAVPTYVISESIGNT